MSASELAERPTETSEVFAADNGRTGNGRRLSLRTKTLMCQLHESGKTLTEIAQVVGCSVPTVSYTLDSLADHRVIARRMLDAGAPTLVKTVLKSKDAATALRALGKLDVVREDGPNHSVNVGIAIGQPGQALAPPSIQISAGADIRPLSPVSISDLACGNGG